MWTDAATAAAWATAITTPIVAVIRVLSSKGIDALVKWRVQKQAEKQQDYTQLAAEKASKDMVQEKGFLIVINEITKSRDEALVRLDRTNDQLLAAVQEREFLKGQDREKTAQIAALTRELAELHDEIKQLRKRTHEISNDVSAVKLTQAEQRGAQAVLDSVNKKDEPK